MKKLSRILPATLATLTTLASFMSQPASATLETPVTILPVTTELVQSIPDETQATLAHPKLRFAKDVWIEMIQNAKTTIDLGQFYLAGDAKLGPELESVIDALHDAGKRGVKIRLMISDAMANEYPITMARMKAIPGLELRIYNLRKLTGGILHAKYWIIDEKEIFVGSQNFDWRALTQIHELGIRTNDALAVKKTLRVFNLDWDFCKSGNFPPFMPGVSPQGGEELEFLASPPVLTPVTEIRPAKEALLKLIAEGHKSIQIQVMTYSLHESHEPAGQWTEIDDALRAAAKRGVKVDLIVANWSANGENLKALKSLDAQPNIDVRIATIPTHSVLGEVPYSRVTHSKQMIVDGKTLWVGTSNWTRGYFDASRNFEFILRNEERAQEGQELFTRLWRSPYVKSATNL